MTCVRREARAGRPAACSGRHEPRVRGGNGSGSVQ